MAYTGGHGVHRGGSGEPLVLIHGFSGTRLIWEPALAALQGSHDVLAVNLAGHVGGPELDGAAASVAAVADAVEQDMDAAGFPTAHLVGNSLGGWIALELAARGRARLGRRALAGRRMGGGLPRREPAAEPVHPQPQTRDPTAPPRRPTDAAPPAAAAAAGPDGRPR